MLEVRGVSKHYGGVQALAGVDFTVRAGTVHALLGENGAGKSTLVKIIAGAGRADAGIVRLDAREVSFANTADAARHGVAVVSQELNLFPDLDLIANLFPARELRRGPIISRRAMERRAAPILAELELDIRPRQRVGELTLAQRQLVEIAKALVTQPTVLILDEPTSALDAASTDTLMRIVRVLRDRRVAVVFVSHILEEVMAVSDEVTVLRDGHVVMAARPRAELTVPTIVAAMLGEHDVAGTDAAAPQARHAAAVSVDESGGGGALRFEDISTRSGLIGVSFSCARGEIVGVAGLTGAGHAIVLELATGQRRPAAGRVLMPNGRPVPHGVRAAIAAGIALVTGDRRRYGLILDKPIWENIAQVRAIAQARDGLHISKARLRERARDRVTALRVATPTVDAKVDSLSGGNQQKVLFAKWLEAAPSVLVLDDPTRGVDVGAKAEMHSLFRAAADGNAVVLLSSTDLDELCQVCDRVLVFHHGRICAEMTGGQRTVHAVLETMNTGEAPRPTLTQERPTGSD